MLIFAAPWLAWVPTSIADLPERADLLLRGCRSLDGIDVPELRRAYTDRVAAPDTPAPLRQEAAAVLGVLPTLEDPAVAAVCLTAFPHRR